MQPLRPTLLEFIQQSSMSDLQLCTGQILKKLTTVEDLKRGARENRDEFLAFVLSATDLPIFTEYLLQVLWNNPTPIEDPSVFVDLLLAVSELRSASRDYVTCWFDGNHLH
jgi:hypothetical protein